MEQRIGIKGKSFTLITDFKANDIYRSSYNDLTRKTYHFDFESWYQGGYWQERYRPYSLLDGDTVVSNVSVNIMDFAIDGKTKRYLQLGTVMTDKSYREQGLCRALMEKVLAHWSDQCEMIYLYANDSVLDFYPKFGFHKAMEYQCSMDIDSKASSFFLARKLDMSNKSNQKLVFEAASHTAHFSKISMIDNPYLILFYGTLFLKDCVYVLDRYNAVVFAEYDGDTLLLHDILSPTAIPLGTVIDAMRTTKTKRVILGFTPIDDVVFASCPLIEKDTTFFIRTDHPSIFEKNQLRFPSLSRT